MTILATPFNSLEILVLSWTGSHTAFFMEHRADQSILREGGVVSPPALARLPPSTEASEDHLTLSVVGAR